ncbi:MAG: cytochrome b N-terminal domain-containing protein [Planctomycetes bacterium]|nr:cytochrome b N-terminal domain-containing protein [Planctomycetota bacterium]
MRKLLNWIDDRTDLRGIVHGALFEPIPGGPRWRYVWGSTLVFTFFLQVCTGLVLWMFYSPGAQSAWESVYFLQQHVAGGAMLRGIHHYTAQAMVVLLAIHLVQVVIDGAYKAPREFNFWIGLLLMLIVLGLALTGYLLPWDQKGYWATKVATRIASSAPVAGTKMEQFAVGGQDYGHYTLTRFFALHAGVLPGTLIFLLAVHVALFRKHGITVRLSQKRPRPDGYFWPEQVWRDAVACLAIFAAVLALAYYLQPELGAPADGADNYAAARPEWYFLFLFQFLKFFQGHAGEVLGAIVIPTLILGFMFLMPLIGRNRVGHRVCVAVIAGLLLGAAGLTVKALYDDYQARWFPNWDYTGVTSVLDEIDIDLRKSGTNSKFQRLDEDKKLQVYFSDAPQKLPAFRKQLASYRAYQASREYLDAVKGAQENAERAQQLAAQGIPPAGALSLLRNDPKTQGPRLFKQNCAACHDYSDANGHGIVTPRPLDIGKDKELRPIDPKRPDSPRAVPTGAPNLYGFGSREWIAGFLDPKRIAAAHFDEKTMLVRDAPYFGNTAHWNGEMVGVVKERLSDLDEEGQAKRQRLIAALSAEAELKSQTTLDAELDKEATAKLAANTPAAERQKKIVASRTKALKGFECTECHKFHDTDEGGTEPDLTGYASRQWLIDFISNPSHARFYRASSNDRMPAFAPDAKNPDNNQLQPRELEMLVDWLRGEWYEPPQAAHGVTSAVVQPTK